MQCRMFLAGPVEGGPVRLLLYVFPPTFACQQICTNQLTAIGTKQIHSGRCGTRATTHVICHVPPTVCFNFRTLCIIGTLLEVRFTLCALTGSCSTATGDDSHQAVAVNHTSAVEKI